MSPSGFDNEGNENRRLATGEAEAIFSSFGLTESSLKEQRPFKHAHRESEVFLADVEADAQSFSNQLYTAMRYGNEEFPCAVLGDSGPVPLDYLDFAKIAWGTRFWKHFEGGPFPPFPFKFWFREMRGEFKEWITGPKVSFTSMHPAEALGTFRGSVIDFLTDRFAGRAQAGVSPSPGIRFKVISQNHGERVHYSPAYFLKLSTVFGAPTTPVVGWIQPGRYLFSVVGMNGQMRIDPGHYSIPPSVSAQLTV